MMRRGLSLWLIILLLAVPLEAATAGQCVRTNGQSITRALAEAGIPFVVAGMNNCSASGSSGLLLGL